MNLNQITTRIGELSAELLTLHKDLAFLVEGAVARQEQSIPAAAVFDWKDLREGDHVHLQKTITGHGGVTVQPGVYKVEMVEGSDYTGTLPFAIYYDVEHDRSCWIRYGGTVGNDLFRKVWM